MTEPLHIGFTGTRFGMSAAQRVAVLDLLDDLLVQQTQRITLPCVAHHGLCVGADAEFHRIVGQYPGRRIVGHPGPDWPDGVLCARITDCDEVLDPMSYAKRNRAIVNASRIMIATPFEDAPQKHSGTWMTIGMARQALQRGMLRELYVVGRDGELRDHGAWRP